MLGWGCVSEFSRGGVWGAVLGGAMTPWTPPCSTRMTPVQVHNNTTTTPDLAQVVRTVLLQDLKECIHSLLAEAGSEVILDDTPKVSTLCLILEKILQHGIKGLPLYETDNSLHFTQIGHCLVTPCSGILWRN